VRNLLASIKKISSVVQREAKSLSLVSPILGDLKAEVSIKVVASGNGAKTPTERYLIPIEINEEDASTPVLAIPNVLSEADGHLDLL
tara:strand:+ start:43359 stop:43619 length:261 start_codon:yes stop_codon:yes gene_type:complete